MKKRISILLVGIAVSAVALIGAFAGIIAAQSNDDGSGTKTFAERVAEILGISSDDVENAMQQAKDAMHDERLDAKFAELVENGTLTQEDADAIRAWQDAKPDIEFSFTDDVRGFKHGWGHGHFGHGGMMWYGSSEKTDYLVDQGIITQADADALSEWWDSRPEALDDMMSTRGGKWGKFGHGGRSGWKFDFSKDADGASNTSSNINYGA